MGSPRNRLSSRRSIRLKDFDYSSAGAYLITICVQDRGLLLGDVVGGEVALWMEGQIVHEVWDGLVGRFPTVMTDAFVVMPNHVHGIVVIDGDHVGVPTDQPVGQRAGAMNRAPTPSSSKPGQDEFASPSLGEVIRVLKAVSTRRIREVGDPSFGWQRNYHERVIRDEREFERARAYIEANPARWAEDVENPRGR